MLIVNRLLLLSIALALSACGVNPVTGKRELQFVSESQEIALGEKSYAPARQSEGGDMESMPELTAYVNEVGQKLAAVADRRLPYQFTVLNNSVPNAWAMPGGKIAVNRGLLTELKSEAELAAVLGHEIVHAAARHGAKAQERGTLMQAGMAVAQIGAVVGGADSNAAGLAMMGGALGLQLTQMKYGREQELESDRYGMQYMKRAGYDPAGAVTLQETFVRLASEKGGKQNAFDRMFASHPPSAERVERNRRMLAELGAGGDIGEERYRTQTAALLAAKPAFDKYDQAAKALSKKDYTNARALASEAVKLAPSEGRFHELLGEIELAQKHYPEAIKNYDEAIRYNPNYFGSYLGGGIARYQAGDKAKAQEWLKRSHDLLPTAPAAYYLGSMARERGDAATAIRHFESAASSRSSYGQMAAKEFVAMDLPQHPEQYVAANLQLDALGRMVAVVENRAPVALANIQLTPVSIDALGGALARGAPLRIAGPLQPGQRIAVNAGLVGVSAEQAQSLRLRIDAAQTAEAKE